MDDEVKRLYLGNKFKMDFEPVYNFALTKIKSMLEDNELKSWMVQSNHNILLKKFEIMGVKIFVFKKTN